MRVQLKAIPYDANAGIPADWEDETTIEFADSKMFPKYLVVVTPERSYLVMKSEVKRLSKSI